MDFTSSQTLPPTTPIPSKTLLTTPLSTPIFATLDGIPKKRNYFLWFLGILILVVILGATFLILIDKSKSPLSGFLVQPLAPQELTTAAATGADVPSWKTYTNSKYGYTIKWPPDKFTSCKVNEFFLFSGPDNNKYNCDFHETVPNFTITINSLGFGYDREINNECYSVTSQDITLSGVQGKKYVANKVVKTPDCSGRYPLNVVNTATVILDHNGNKYAIFYLNNLKTFEQQKLLDQILYTFKFTD